jgi:hypothetical protein
MGMRYGLRTGRSRPKFVSLTVVSLRLERSVFVVLLTRGARMTSNIDAIFDSALWCSTHLDSCLFRFLQATATEYKTVSHIDLANGGGRHARAQTWARTQEPGACEADPNEARRAAHTAKKLPNPLTKLPYQDPGSKYALSGRWPRNV